MGLIIIFLWAMYVFVAMVVIGLVYKFITKKLWINIVVIIFALLLPTYDIILTNIFGAYYCAQDPNPKTFIKKKVEYPESIYWEDNVYPGFSKEDRELMIINYLDGVHLKTMALNGDDGNFFVYTREIPKKEYLEMSNKVSDTFIEIKRMQTFQKDRQDKQYIKNINKLYKEKESIQKKIQKLIESFPVKEKKISKEIMPKLNYTVTFNEVKLNLLASKFLYSDETKIIDNETNETIAYNRRYMRFFYNTFPDLVLGNRYYQQDSACGYKYPNFDEMFNYKRVVYRGGIKHVNGLNQKLYKKYINGEK